MLVRACGRSWRESVPLGLVLATSRPSAVIQVVLAQSACTIRLCHWNRREVDGSGRGASLGAPSS